MELQIQLKETSELRQETHDLKLKFEEVLKEVEMLKESSKSEKLNHFPELPTVSCLSNLHRTRDGPTTLTSSAIVRDYDHVRKVQDLCANARKVVGFPPIEPRMLTLQIDSYGAKDKVEAMHMEVKSYLKCEMKMLPSEIEKLEIVEVFPASSQDESM